MSLNLTLHDGQQIELWQTPTWVTYMCLSYNPETAEPDGVRRRYGYWVGSHLNGSWEDREHLELINSVKQPEFSYV